MRIHKLLNVEPVERRRRWQRLSDRRTSLRQPGSPLQDFFCGRRRFQRSFGCGIYAEASAIYSTAPWQEGSITRARQGRSSTARRTFCFSCVSVSRLSEKSPFPFGRWPAREPSLLCGLCLIASAIENTVHSRRCIQYLTKFPAHFFSHSRSCIACSE